MVPARGEVSDRQWRDVLGRPSDGRPSIGLTWNTGLGNFRSRTCCSEPCRTLPAGFDEELVVSTFDWNEAYDDDEELGANSAITASCPLLPRYSFDRDTVSRPRPHRTTDPGT
jgi:hypothetical protein